MSGQGNKRDPEDDVTARVLTLPPPPSGKVLASRRGTGLQDQILATNGAERLKRIVCAICSIMPLGDILKLARRHREAVTPALRAFIDFAGDPSVSDFELWESVQYIGPKLVPIAAEEFNKLLTQVAYDYYGGKHKPVDIEGRVKIVHTGVLNGTYVFPSPFDHMLRTITGSEEKTRQSPVDKVEPSIVELLDPQPQHELRQQSSSANKVFFWIMLALGTLSLYFTGMWFLTRN